MVRTRTADLNWSKGIKGIPYHTISHEKAEKAIKVRGVCQGTSAARGLAGHWLAEGEQLLYTSLVCAVWLLAGLHHKGVSLHEKGLPEEGPVVLPLLSPSPQQLTVFSPEQPTENSQTLNGSPVSA